MTLIDKLKLRWYLTPALDSLGLWVKPRIQADADGNIGISGDQAGLLRHGFLRTVIGPDSG